MAWLGTAAAAGLLLPGRDKLAKTAGAGPAVINKRSDQVVSFKYPDNPSFDLVYLADSLGYFEGTRTKPNYIGKIAAPQIIPLVGTGEIDFGSRMVPLVISAIASGLDLLAVCWWAAKSVGSAQQCVSAGQHEDQRRSGLSLGTLAKMAALAEGSWRISLDSTSLQLLLRQHSLSRCI